MEKRYENRIIFCILLYGIVTVICGILCLFLPRLQGVVFCVWYMLTLILWAVTAVFFVVLCLELMKLERRKKGK